MKSRKLARQAFSRTTSGLLSGFSCGSNVWIETEFWIFAAALAFRRRTILPSDLAEKKPLELDLHRVVIGKFAIANL